MLTVINNMNLLILLHFLNFCVIFYLYLEYTQKKLLLKIYFIFDS